MGGAPVTYTHHLCSERGCDSGLRRAHERVRAMHHEQVMGRIRAAGRPGLRTTVPTTLQLPARGPDLDVAWIDEPVPWITPAPVLRVKPPFNLREVVSAPDDSFEALVREQVMEFNRKLLAEWEAMLKILPAPPEGMAWFPVTEMNDRVDWDSNRATITYRLRPELRDA